MDTRKVQKGRAGALGGGAGLVEPWPVVGAGHDVGARLLVVPKIKEFGIELCLVCFYHGLCLNTVSLEKSFGCKGKQHYKRTASETQTNNQYSYKIDRNG